MTSANPDPRLTSHPPREVALAAIERELNQLWKPPEGDGATYDVLVRACMSNLIIYCATREQARDVAEQVPAIVRAHPCRVLLLTGEAEDPEDDIDAYVSAHCHLVGDHHQVCSEHVTINASGDAALRLPSTARELLIGDLPTSLWWASHEAPPLGGPLFTELEEMAEQVVYSSLTWTDPVRGTIAAARWAAGADPEATRIADLSWRRLKPWRRLISQTLDPAVRPGALEAIRLVEVEHGPRGLPQAWLLVGWLAACLGWRPAGRTWARGWDYAWRFRAAHGPVEVRLRRLDDGDPEVRDVAASWRSGGQSLAMTFAMTAPGRLAAWSLSLEAEPHILQAPIQSGALLVAFQLQDFARDTLFFEALRASRTMAEALT
jgi:glucose-6-phosphate dehydrogenase assembly protein OpcA